MAMVMLVIAASAAAFETRAYQAKEDFSVEHLSDCVQQYYYYIPCPTHSWFWAFTGWEPGDVIGEWYQVGDASTGTVSACDPANCLAIDQIRFVSFSGYGCTYPWYEGLHTQEFDVYCSDENGCPVGPSLWNSGPVEPCEGFNYLPVDPPVSLCGCSGETGPRILLTATHVGTDSHYPSWGLDNISSALRHGCAMHDDGCLPALYPRPYADHYASIHSGFFGNGFEYCPPQWFRDPRDTTPDCTLYGHLELAWSIYLSCTGPSPTRPATWSSIKSMYR
jgi:hypothetical protein